MRERPTQNPLSRFAAQEVVYDPDEGPPPSTVTLLEDHSRSILSSNDSPDLGFRWSANPYRGCLHACAYCVSGDTQVLLGDGRTRPIADLVPGDEIYGTTFDGERFRFVRTRVLDHWQTFKPAFRIALSDGTTIIASGDHRFLTMGGWQHVHSFSHRTSLVGIDHNREVVFVEPVAPQPLFDITTGTGDFIANGVVSHNCYARPTHEYLDMGAGTDFDTKIVVKPKAAELLREAFDKPSWKGERVVFSGVTDCYQAIEAKLGLTRACLEVCLEYKNPVGVISKSALIERDVELFAALAREAGASVMVSLAWGPSAEAAELARQIEPWAATPRRRLQVIETFAKAGVPIGVMIAPVIPGLNDDQIPSLLEAAAAAGADRAHWTMLRLPGAVASVFEERLRIARPLAADKVLHRIRGVRGGGKLNDARFHSRGSGEGVYAELIAQLFETHARRVGLWRGDDEAPDPPSRFQRPLARGPQLSLF